MLWSPGYGYEVGGMGVMVKEELFEIVVEVIRVSLTVM